MDLSTLKRWRVVVPSILLALVFLPAIKVGLDLVPPGFFPEDLAGDIVKWAVALIFLPLGFIYDALQVRGALNRASHQRINLYVESQLRLTLQPLVSQAALDAAPVGDRRWMRLLYKCVDTDSTLQELAKLIRDNGLRWTTAADIATIFIAGGLLSGLFASFLDATAVVYWALFLALVGVLSLFLIPSLEKKHVELCGDQQAHIRHFLSASLAADFAKAFP